MNLHDYYEWAPSTRTETYVPLCNSMLGLFGEWSEVHNTIDELEELGDFAWYIANLAHDVNYELFDVLIGGYKDGWSFRYVSDYERPVYQVLGSLAELIKKLMRDGVYDEDIGYDIIDLLMYFAGICETCGYNYEHVLQANHDKLETRKANDQIHSQNRL